MTTSAIALSSTAPPVADAPRSSDRPGDLAALAASRRQSLLAEARSMKLLREASRVLCDGMSMLQGVDTPDLHQEVRQHLHQAIALVHGAVDRLDLLPVTVHIARIR